MSPCKRACRDSMTQLLQNSGGGASIPYMFLPGNHEARTHMGPFQQGPTAPFSAGTFLPRLCNLLQWGCWMYVLKSLNKNYQLRLAA